MSVVVVTYVRMITEAFKAKNMVMLVASVRIITEDFDAKRIGALNI